MIKKIIDICDGCEYSKYESDTNSLVCTRKGGCDHANPEEY